MRGLLVLDSGKMSVRKATMIDEMRTVCPRCIDNVITRGMTLSVSKPQEILLMSLTRSHRDRIRRRAARSVIGNGSVCPQTLDATVRGSDLHRIHSPQSVEGKYGFARKLTGGHFVAEPDERILRRRVAPPVRVVLREVEGHREAESGET